MISPITNHVRDVGTPLILRLLNQDGLPISVSDATIKQFWFKKPGPVYVKEDVAFFTNGADGYLQYVFDEDDLDSVGVWTVQIYVELTTSKLHSNHFQFMVSPNVEA